MNTLNRTQEEMQEEFIKILSIARHIDGEDEKNSYLEEQIEIIQKYLRIAIDEDKIKELDHCKKKSNSNKTNTNYTKHSF